MNYGMKLLTAMILMNACGKPSETSVIQEAWNRRNDPQIMGIDALTREYQYETQFDLLALSADLPTIPWSDSYWPTHLGGLSYRWAQDGSDFDRYVYQSKSFADLTPGEIAVLSPVEKYDFYMSFADYRTTVAERERTGVLKRIPGQPGYNAKLRPIPTWEGLCHAWAPATLAFDEPRSVILKNKEGMEIPFSSSDIKGLLAMFLHHVPSPHTSFLGGRCGEDLSSIQEKIEEARDPYEGSVYFNLTEPQRAEELKKLEDELKSKGERSECRDTNAGAFHLVLTNQIARLQEGFIADVTRDDEVWNQAVYGFDVVISEVKEGSSPLAAPHTVKEITVTTTMKYIVEVDYHHERGGYNPHAATTSVEYEYTLELDKKGAVIGGKWLSFDRPDFLWKQITPKFEGFFSGVEQIYKASTAAAF